MEPVFNSDKLNGIPKMIITQFCRGESMHSTTQFDSVKMSKNVNGQECYFERRLIMTLFKAQNFKICQEQISSRNLGEAIVLR